MAPNVSPQAAPRIIIEAAIKEGVKKLVLTSSCAAITETHTGQTDFSEDDWTDAAHAQTPAYYKSKTLAEQKAWDLIGTQSTTKLAVINPAGVIGPTLSDDIGTASEFVLQIIDGKVPGCPKLHIGFVDVRDVAAAHILAMQKSEADGERFIISEREFWFKEFSKRFEKCRLRESPDTRNAELAGQIFRLFRSGNTTNVANGRLGEIYPIR